MHRTPTALIVFSLIVSAFLETVLSRCLQLCVCPVLLVIVHVCLVSYVMSSAVLSRYWMLRAGHTRLVNVPVHLMHVFLRYLVLSRYWMFDQGSGCPIPILSRYQVFHACIAMVPPVLSRYRASCVLCWLSSPGGWCLSPCCPPGAAGCGRRTTTTNPPPRVEPEIQAVTAPSNERTGTNDKHP